MWQSCELNNTVLYMQLQSDTTGHWTKVMNEKTEEGEQETEQDGGQDTERKMHGKCFNNRAFRYANTGLHEWQYFLGILTSSAS